MSDAKVYVVKSDLTTGAQISREIVTGASGTENYPQIASNGDTTIAVWEGSGNSKDLYINIFKSDLNDFMTADSYAIVDSSNSQYSPDIEIFNDQTTSFKRNFKTVIFQSR